MTEYTPLPEEILTGHFKYTQLKRVGDVAIYQQKNRAHGATRYEVIRIRKQEEKTIEKDGTVINLEAKELYPYAEQWGIYAWTTFKARTAAEVFNAIRFFDTLSKKEQKRYQNSTGTFINTEVLGFYTGIKKRYQNDLKRFSSP